MDKITLLYENRQFGQCITQLSKGLSYSDSSLIQQLICDNNLAASKYQQSYVTGDEILRKTAKKELHQVWSKLLCFPRDRKLESKFNQTSLMCACNIVYSVVDEGSTTRPKDVARAFEIGFQSVEIVCAQLGLPLCLELDSIKDSKLVFLAGRLIRSERLGVEHLSLLVYLLSLLCFLEAQEDLFSLLQEVKTSDNDYHLEKASKDCFLLFPLGYASEEQQQFQTIRDLSTAIQMTIYFQEYLSRRSLKDGPKWRDIQHQKLRRLGRLLEASILPHSSSSNDTVPVTKEIEQQDSHMKFAEYLTSVARLTSNGNLIMALKFLSVAAAHELGGTQACALVMTYSAALFKALGENECQIEALRTAEEALLKSIPNKVSFHGQLSGFLLDQLPLFQNPSLGLIQYQLGRALLQAERYKEAATVYEKIIGTGFSSNKTEAIPDALQLKSPTSQAVSHEYVLSLLKTTDLDRTLDAISSVSNDEEEDFLQLILQAEARVQMNQHRKAVQLFNRAVGQLKIRSERLLMEDSFKERIRAKIHCRLAEVLDSLGSAQDAFHQLRIAVQLAPNDTQISKFQLSFTRDKIRRQQPSSTDNQPDEVMEQLLKLDDWALHCFIRDGRL